MMHEGLVSILTPCYNTSHIVHRLLDSILIQTYHSVEMFCIDDGSTDNTREVVESYITKFQVRGYQLTYVRQENGGQSVAINNGLKLVTGEYLIWPDSDDYYSEKTALSQFVKAFDENPRASVVRCLSKFVNEETQEEISRIEDDPIHHRTNLFDDSVLCTNNFYWGAGNYMIRTAALDAALPDREIYTEKSAGQNWQMIMPLLYKQECITIADYFHNILMRQASHSRGQFAGYERTMEKVCVYERTILGTLDKMKNYMGDDYALYYEKVQNAYSHGKMVISILACKKKEAKRHLRELEARKVSISKIDRIACSLCGTKLSFIIVRLVMRITGSKL